MSDRAIKKTKTNNKPKYRAKMNVPDEDPISVFVWQLGNNQSEVSHEVDSEKHWVHSDTLSGFKAIERSWA